MYDLVALLFKRGHPFVDSGRWDAFPIRIPTPTIDVGDGKKIMELSVVELHE